MFPNNTLDSLLKMHNKGNYWFYHKENFPNEPPLLYNELIKSATSYIEIFDPYFNVTRGNNDQNIFNDIKSNITIKILACKGIYGNDYFTLVKNAIKTKILPSKNVRFGMRVIDQGNCNNSGYFFHDRFLIIDQIKFYLVGGSIGYHVTPHMSTGIYEVNDLDAKQLVKEIFDEYWNKAANKEIPVQYTENL